MKIKFNRSIAFRILFFYTALALINVSFIIFIIFENQVDLISTNSRLEIEKQFSNLIDVLKKSSDEMEKGTLFQPDLKTDGKGHLLALMKNYATEYFIITEKNEIVYRSASGLEPPGTTAGDVLRSITVKNFSGREYYLRIDEEKRIMYGYIPFDSSEKGNRILLVVKRMDQLDESLRNLYKQAVFVIAVVLFFHAVFALMLFRYIIKPVRELDRGARKISRGEFDTRIPLTGAGDEFVNLASSFNGMAETIQENMKKMSGEIESSRDARKRTENLTVRDELTGLLNRTYMLERLGEETMKSGSEMGGISFMMIDIDGFRNIRSVYGPDSGDIVLYQTSKIIARNCSENDLVSRFAENVFIVLSLRCSLDNARDMSERIRAAVEKNTVVTPDGNLSVTVSIGLFISPSSSPAGVMAVDYIIAEAEKALDRAKELGRNRVEIIS